MLAVHPLPFIDNLLLHHSDVGSRATEADYPELEENGGNLRIIG
jgi:hypothetical protein